MSSMTDEQLEELNRELEANLGRAVYNLSVIRLAGAQGSKELLPALRNNASVAMQSAAAIHDAVSSLADHFDQETP